MIQKLFIFIVSSILLIESISADGQQGGLAVLQQPSYYSYDNSNTLKLSDFKNLILAGGGFSIQKPIEWKGLTSKNSLSTPRVTLLFLVDKEQVNVKSFSQNVIQVNQDTDVDFDYLTSLNSQSNVVVRNFEELPLEINLKNLEEDCSKNSIFYVLHAVDSHNLADRINQLVGNVSSKCSAVADQKNDLLVYLLSADLTDNSRVKRQAKTVKAKALINGVVTNEAIFYSDQYPAMFNLIFWISLVLSITVFAIAYGMCNMDPGLNTVIYRMTSQRIKKDQ